MFLTNRSNIVKFDDTIRGSANSRAFAWSGMNNYSRMTNMSQIEDIRKLELYDAAAAIISHQAYPYNVEC